jgi:hypothetical protein
VRDLHLLSRPFQETEMAQPKKPSRPTRAPAKPAAAPPAAAQLTKAAAEFQRFKAARAAATGSETAPPPEPPSAPAPMAAMPPWTMPPSFALPQPGVVQPAPLAVGPLGDRLGSTLRLGIDVINMALAGSLRLLGSVGQGGWQRHYGDHCGCGRHSPPAVDCCCVFEADPCCTPSVGNCRD